MTDRKRFWVRFGLCFFAGGCAVATAAFSAWYVSPLILAMYVLGAIDGYKIGLDDERAP